MPGTKHLIQCHCVLPQYRRMKDPVFHQFVVYSKINKDGTLKPKVGKCNNCGVFHNVIDFCKSEILHDYEGDGFLITIDDIEDQCYVDSNHLTNGGQEIIANKVARNIISSKILDF